MVCGGLDVCDFGVVGLFVRRGMGEGWDMSITTCMNFGNSFWCRGCAR